MLSLFFGFNGRINRTQYWLASTVALVAALALFIGAGVSVFSALDAKGRLHGDVGVTLLLCVVGYAAVVWVNMAIQVKRLHDRGRSGYLALLMFAPLINIPASIFFLIDLGFMPSKPESNEHGPPPGGGFGGVSTARPPTTAPSGPSAANALASAEQAMQRAIAERARAPQPVQPSRPGPQPGPAGAARGFGQRAART